MRLPQSGCLTFVYALLLGVTLCHASAFAETPSRVTLGTATKGGGFQLFGQHLAETINNTDNSLRIEAIATKGSTQNLPYLKTGKVDIGLIEGNAASQTLQAGELKVLSVMYPNPGMFVVRADSPYRRIEDLKGQKIAIGTQSSGLRILAGDVLDGIGFRAGRDFEDVVLDKAGDGPRLVTEKKVAALWGAGIGWPGFEKLAHDPAGARFIAPSAAQLKQILAKHPQLKTMSVPAGSYPGQATQIDSVGLWSLIMVRQGMSDEVVYRLARALHRGEVALAKQLAQAAYTTAKNTVEQVSLDHLHPGAIRYYREAGLLH